MLPFDVVKPDVDERAQPGEPCLDLARRLAKAKARAGAALRSGLIIGSDQVAELDGIALGKPGTTENAFAQLAEMRGRAVVFHTALALFNTESGRMQERVVPTVVRMRSYSDAAIRHYLAHEDALDCAGGAKSEGLGAALISRMESDDPTALIGLPLLALVDMLSAEGVEVLA
jgi:septum formation protein